MPAVLFLLGTWSRRRRIALAGVAVVAAASLGFVLLAGLGAHRADGAWDRLNRRARAGDAALDVPSIDTARDVATRARRVPGVARAAAMGYGYLVPEGRSEDFFGGVILPFGPGDSEQVWRPALTAGRHADPTRVDEVVVNELFVEVAGLGVGGRFTLVDPVGLISQPMTIVGVGVHPNDFTLGGASPLSYPTEGFWQAWNVQLAQLFDTAGAEVLGPAVFVTGVDGVDATELTARLAASLPEGATGVTDLPSTAVLVIDTLDLQRNGYAALAVVAGFSVLAMLALVLARITRLPPTESTALRAVGFSSRGLRLAVLLPGALVSASGVAGAIGVATVGQSLVPTGLAERVGAGRGLGDDIGFIVLSGLATGLALAGMVAVLASRSVRTPRIDASSARPRSALLAWPSLGAGLRAATGGMASAGRRQAMAAFAAVAVGSVGIVAVAVVVRSRDGLRADPSRLGKFFDVYLYSYTDPGVLASDTEALVASPAVAGVATIESFRVQVDGVGTAGDAVTAQKGVLAATIVDGRLPVGDDELVASVPFLRQLDRSIGDRVNVSGPAGTRPFRIVGTAALPYVSNSTLAGEQLAITADGRRGLGIEPESYVIGADLGDPDAARSVRSGYDDLEACDQSAILELLGVERLEGPESGAVSLCVPRSDVRVSNLDELGALPQALIGFLLMLGTAGLGYLLTASFRSARRDLAVLRVLGFTRRQSVVTILVQAGAVGLVEALLALPVGIGLGRAAWRGVAEELGIVVVPEVPIVGTLGVVVGAVVVAELLALPFASRTVTRPPAELLRVE